MTPSRLTLPLLLLLGLSGVARAQTTTGMAGTCTGSYNNTSIAGNIYLLVNGKQVTPQSGTAGGIFDLAECQCHPQDATAVQMHILMTSLLPLSVIGAGVEMYIGDQQCSMTNDQSTGTCEPVPNILQVSQPNPPGSNISTLEYTAFQSNQPIDIPLPADILSDPLSQTMRNMNPPPTHTCDNISNTSWNVTLLVGPNNNMPYATCQLAIPVKTTPPPAPTVTNVGVGDSALTVQWDITGAGQAVERYQVLCRDTATTGAVQPSFDPSSSLYYSACVNNKLYRRVDIPGVGTTTGTTPTTDGGTTTGTGTMSVMQPLRRAPVSPPPGPLDNPDGGISDGGTVDDMSGPAPPDFAGFMFPDFSVPADMASTDLAVASCNGAASPLDTLDPMYLCSGSIQGTGTSLSQRIDGLANGHTYEIKVVAIDYFGNPAGSCTVTGVPTPTENLGEALALTGNSGLGFGCAATRHPAGFGLPPLLGLLGIGLYRRRRGVR